MRLLTPSAPLILSLLAVPSLAFAPLGGGACLIRNRVAPGFVCRHLSSSPRPVAALETSAFPRSVPSTLTAVRMEVAYKEERYKIAENFEIAARVWGDPKGGAEKPQHRWIALHGWADNAGTFDLLAPLLMEKHGATCVVCYDAAGHGLSDHRQFYHASDAVTDAVRVMDALEWENCSVLGHSLGGCTSQALAAALPERILRVLAIEAMGWFASDGETILSQIRSAALHQPKRTPEQKSSWTTYKDLDAAAERRAKQNIGGSMAKETAMHLVTRGTKPSPGGSGLIWTSDPKILAPTVRMGEEVMRAMFARIRAPHAIVLAADGMFKRGQLFKMPLLSPQWAVTVSAGYFLARVWQWIKNPFKPVVSDISKGATAAGQLKFLHNLLQRFRRTSTCEVIRVEDGGHHPHLTRVADTLAAATPWLLATSSTPVKPVEPDV